MSMDQEVLVRASLPNHQIGASRLKGSYGYVIGNFSISFRF